MVRDYCGNHVYRDRVLERINNDYGYWAGGNWYYHIKDYQGNVRAVIDHAGVLKEVNNYYPYGALMGGGSVGGNAGVQPYKYGGKELDRQNGLDWYDSQARMYDPLLGRTPTMDPLSEKYYSISPYAWCAGNPVYNIDPDGNIIRTYIDGIAYDYQLGKDGTYGFYNQNGELYNGPNTFAYDLTNSLQILQEGRFGKMFISDIINSENIATICYTKESNSTLIENNTINWDPDNLDGGISWNFVNGYSKSRPSYIGLGHELAHISDAWFGNYDETFWFKFNNKDVDKTEIYASQIENKLRAEHNIPLRTHYASREITLNGKNFIVPYAPARIPNGLFYYKRPLPLKPVSVFNYFSFH